MSNQILYFLDKGGISEGYRPLYNAILMQTGLKPHQVRTASIYAAVPDAVLRKSETKWVVNHERIAEIRAAVDKFIAATSPRIIVCSCPAAISILTNGQSSIENNRGCNYIYRGIPVIILYPVSAIHRHLKRKQPTRMEQDDGEGVESPPAPDYTVKAGKWIVVNDWQKVSRFYHSKRREQPAFGYHVVRTLREGSIAEAYLNECFAISTDIETQNGFISCIGYCGFHPDGRVFSFVFPFFDRFKLGGIIWSSDDHGWLFRCCQRINNNRAFKIGQNFTYDCSWFIRDRLGIYGYNVDLIHLWHSTYPELDKSLDFISSLCLDNVQYWKDDSKGIKEKDVTKRDTDMERYWRYNALDCYYAGLSAFFLLQLVMKQSYIQHNYKEEFYMALSAELMSYRGMKADKQRLNSYRGPLKAKGDAAVKRLQIMVDDPEFNPNSPDQVRQLIYNVLGAPARKVKGKFGATDEHTLKLIRAEHPIYKAYIDTLWDAKKPFKAISNICDVRMWTDRFRTKLSPAGTVTWRFNSKGSDFWDGRNAQNLQEVYRDFICADPGYIYVNADFSQSDAVFVAYESNDPDYIATVTSGKDTHCVHAAHFFKRRYEEVLEGFKRKDAFYYHPTKGIRPITKRIVHGANFQMAADTLYATMGREAVIAAAIALGRTDAHKWPVKQLVNFCGIMLREYRRLYKRLAPWYGEIEASLKRRPILVNAFGMTRMFFGDVNDSETQREATAFFGQSGTAGNINRTLKEIMWGVIPERFRDGDNPLRRENPIILDRTFTGRGMHCRVNLQVHDNILMQVPKSNFLEAISSLLTVMERPIIINGHKMVVKADVKVGVRWGEGMLAWDDPLHEKDWDAICFHTSLEQYLKREAA